MKRLSVLLFLALGLSALTLCLPGADAFESLYTANCTDCHSSTVPTCNGCHAHGVHSSNAKDDINVTGVTDNSTYAPGETVTVTITGGYRTGWIRAILYDENMTELAKMSCAGGQGGCTDSVYPVTLTAPAPSTPGTYTWNVSWYGNQFDAAGAVFGDGWTPDPNNPDHGEEIVSTNSFEVTQAQEPDINLEPSSLDFGTVMIGDSPVLTTDVQNLGDADLEVTNITLCTGTSTEFSSSSAPLPFIVAPGGTEMLSVTYSPTDTGIDTGCLEITSNDPDEATIQLQVSGAVLEIESECFDAIDNDGDGLSDCEDPDCAGAVDGACETGQPGVCAAGTTQCQDGAPACIPDTMPAPETIAADNCNDGLDNDCDGLADAEDPDCILPPPTETECFDGIDDDGDGAIDCADSDCAGAIGPATDCGIGACASTGNRVCQDGVEVDTCTPGAPGTEVCTGGIDEDCDGLADCLDAENCDTDPACAAVENECFDGIDDDLDGLVDCADSDCEGAANGDCDTGIPGVCATGQTQCVEGSAQCIQTVLPSAEICDDTLDNNCDGLTDADDPDCQVEGGDVGLIKLIVPKKIVIAKKNETAQKVINVLVDPATESVSFTDARTVTVTLTAETGAGVMVTIDPPSITEEVESEMSEEGEIEAERFGFRTTIVCTEKGTWAVNWTATIAADQNSDPANDILEGTSQVICKSPAKHSN